MNRACSITQHQHQQHPEIIKIDNINHNNQQQTTTVELQQKTHWGAVKPYLFDKSTNIPSLTITNKLSIALLINLTAICLLCIVHHLIIQQSLTTSPNFQSNTNRNLQVQENTVVAIYHPLLQSSQQSIIQNKPRITIHFNRVYLSTWTIYQLIALFLLLLSNPGYCEYYPSAAAYRQHLKENSQNKREDQLCQVCRSVVDNSVHHCPYCDVCCEGFSHHCKWLGKCIGHRNLTLFKLYTMGYLLGLLINVVSQLMLTRF